MEFSLEVLQYYFAAMTLVLKLGWCRLYTITDAGLTIVPKILFWIDCHKCSLTLVFTTVMS